MAYEVALMEAEVNRKIRFHIEMIDKLLLSLRSSVKLHVVLFWVGVVATVTAFAYSSWVTEPGKFDATEASGIVTSIISLFPLTLFLNCRWHINLLSGFRQNLEGSTYAADLSDDVIWAIEQVKDYIEKQLGKKV